MECTPARSRDLTLPLQVGKAAALTAVKETFNQESFEVFVPLCVRKQINKMSSYQTVPPATEFEAAILFADISGFTALTELLAKVCARRHF